MKNRKVLGTRRNGTPYLRNNDEINRYVSGERMSMSRQIKNQGFDMIKSPQIVVVWCHFYSCPAQGLPTFDIDGAVTTVLEMLQPRSVSDLGSVFPVYSNDRQARGGHQTEEFVDSLKFEKAKISIWIPSKAPYDFILDINNVYEYNLSIPANPEYSTYSDLSGILGD